MNLVFLQTAQPGLRWMKRYYREQPQLNAERVMNSFDAALDRLAQDPFAGHTFDNYEQVRELPLARCPFSILFTRRDDTVYVIDVRDQRGLRSAAALQAFTAELRRTYNLNTDT